MTTSGDPSAKLCGEILAEGARRAEGIREVARKEGGAILALAASDAEKARMKSLEATQEEAARRRDRILAGVPIEVARRRAAHIEGLLLSLRERALENLMAREGFSHREALAALAAEALGQMEGEAFAVSLAPPDLAVSEGLAEEILRRAGKPGLKLTLSEDPSILGGGFILRDAEGLQMWDDRLPVRLDRLWPALRLPIARAVGLAEEGVP